MNTTLPCPYCGGQVPEDTTICPDCHEDLAPLVRLEREHAILYNEGLAAAQAGDLDTARIKVLCALERETDFVPAVLLLAKIAAAQGDWPLARRTGARALDLAGDDVRVRRLVAAVEAAALEHAPAARPPRGAAPRPSAASPSRPQARGRGILGGLLGRRGPRGGR